MLGNRIFESGGESLREKHACSIMLLSAKGNSGILSVGVPMHFEKIEPDHEDELRCRILKPRNGLCSSCFHLQVALFCVLREH